MSGHSKWSTIKHKKAKLDAQRGKVFTRLIKEIVVAAREGGGDETSNPKLRTALLNAKAANMPNANIDRAIKKGTGELPGTTIEQGIYEAYGPGGAALIIEVLTDNKNRTVSDVRHLLSKHGGNMAEAGSVAWVFEKKGVIVVEKAHITEEELMELVLDFETEDINSEGDTFEITTSIDALESVKGALTEANVPFSSANQAMVPKSTVKLEGKHAEQMLTLIEALEDYDDVQNVYANFDIDESVMQAFAQ